MSANGHRPTTIFEYEGCVWFDGCGCDAIPDAEPEWPSVEIRNGEDSFCELWLGHAERACTGATRSSRPVILRFLLGALVRQAVENFVEGYPTWRTDADVATTHDLVRRLEVWLTDLCQNEL